MRIRFLSGSLRPAKNASFRRIHSSPTGAPDSKSLHGRRRKASSSKPSHRKGEFYEEATRAAEAPRITSRLKLRWRSSITFGRRYLESISKRGHCWRGCCSSDYILDGWRRLESWRLVQNPSGGPPPSRDDLRSGLFGAIKEGLARSRSVVTLW